MSQTNVQDCFPAECLPAERPEARGGRATAERAPAVRPALRRARDLPDCIRRSAGVLRAVAAADRHDVPPAAGGRTSASRRPRACDHPGRCAAARRAQQRAGDDRRGRGDARGKRAEARAQRMAAAVVGLGLLRPRAGLGVLRPVRHDRAGVHAADHRHAGAAAGSGGGDRAGAARLPADRRLLRRRWGRRR